MTPPRRQSNQHRRGVGVGDGISENHDPHPTPNHRRRGVGVGSHISENHDPHPTHLKSWCKSAPFVVGRHSPFVATRHSFADRHSSTGRHSPLVAVASRGRHSSPLVAVASRGRQSRSPPLVSNDDTKNQSSVGQNW